MLPGIHIPMLGGGGGPDIENTANLSNTGNETVYTFSSAALGIANANRLIAITIRTQDQGGGVGAVTIGGQSATKTAQLAQGNFTTLIAYADVPTGTTGNIVINSNGSAWVNCLVSVYRIVGHRSSTPIDTDTEGGLNIDPTVNFPSPPSNGVAIYAFMANLGTDGPGTWSGGVTESVSAQIETDWSASAMFGPGNVPDSTFDRDAGTWALAVISGAAWI